MPRIADGGVLKFKELAKKNHEIFENETKSLVYEEIPKDERIKFLVDGPKKLPERVTSDNLLSFQKRKVFSNGVKIIVYTAMMLDEDGNIVFTKSGRCWVQIYNDNKTDTKMVWVREFKKELAHLVFLKLLAYIKVIENIVKNWPQGAILEKNSDDGTEAKFYWNTFGRLHYLDVLQYLGNLTPAEVLIVKTKERKDHKYLERSVGTVKLRREEVLKKKGYKLKEKDYGNKIEHSRF